MRSWEDVNAKCDIMEWDNDLDEYVAEQLAEDPLDERELYFLMEEE